MTEWTQRPRLEATLLNPALLAVLLASAAHDYEDTKARMPWPVAFLVLPMVMHRPTREVLPRDTRTHFSTWVRRNPLLRAGFPDRATAMAPLTREGIRYGIRGGILDLDSGTMGGAALDRPAGEVGQLMKAAALIGRWIAKTDQPSTAFALLGVAP
jgi:Family of unknown function (DUF6521)